MFFLKKSIEQYNLQSIILVSYRKVVLKIEITLK